MIRSLAQELLEQLASGCERIEIAGSIRRGKADPKDIELVAIAKLESLSTVDMFGQAVSGQVENKLESRIHGLLDWQFDSILPRNGPKYKRLRHIETGICCDLFIVTPESWGVQFAIRTGPGDFSKELVTRAIRRGMKVDGGKLWKVHNDGSRDELPTPNEHSFFDWLGLTYIEPNERTVKAIWSQKNGR